MEIRKGEQKTVASTGAHRTLPTLLLPGNRSSRQSRATREPMASALGRNRQPVEEGKGHLTSRNGELAQQLFRLLPEKKTGKGDGLWLVANSQGLETELRGQNLYPNPNTAIQSGCVQHSLCTRLQLLPHTNAHPCTHALARII